MTRGYLINHLIEKDCYPDEECDSTVSQLWRNGANVCYVPYEDEFTLTTYCHIFYELKIEPPLEYDADYDVYTSFRKHRLGPVEDNVRKN